MSVVLPEFFHPVTPNSGGVMSRAASSRASASARSSGRLILKKGSTWRPPMSMCGKKTAPRHGQRPRPELCASHASRMLRAPARATPAKVR